MSAIRNPQEPGWYLARPSRPSPAGRSDDPPVIVRVVPDPGGGSVTTVWCIGSRDPQTLDQWSLVGKVKISGDVTNLELDRAQKEAHADGVKQGREDAHRERVEYEARRDLAHPRFPAGIAMDTWTPGIPVVAIEIPLHAAEPLSVRLSDFLCWARGYNAALRPEDFDRAPIGVESIRDINVALKKALERADEAKEAA